MTRRQVVGVLMLGGLFLAGSVSAPPAALAGERLLNIAVHVQGDKAHNGNLEPLLNRADVTLKNTRTGQSWSGKTLADGRVEFRNVPLGPFKVTAEYKGVSRDQTTNAAVSNVYFKLPVKK